MMRDDQPTPEASENGKVVLLLVERAKEGDTEAFGGLVRLYKEKAYGLALSFLRHPQDAEDVSQEAFLKAFEKIKTYNPALGSFGSWLLQIVANLSRNKLRWKKIRDKWLVPIDRSSGGGEEDIPDLQIADPDVKSDPSVGTEGVLQNEEIVQAVDSLPEQQKTVLHLKFVQGYKISEIAKIMGLAEGTVKSHLFRGMESLKKIVGEK